MDRVHFILNGNVVQVEVVDPTRSVLQFLREDRQLCGTKEGCAEGDCGACTVVLAELRENELHYEAVNACIQFLPTLQGKALFTVEYLKSAAGELHPVQQSLVDNHASQCGFCTPGFVMSMFALYQKEGHPDRLEIDDALSGNLCRCTGYKPIIEACERMADYPARKEAGQRLIDQLRALPTLETEIDNGTDRFSAPTTLKGLADEFLARPTATLLAGGTDVGLWVTKQLRELPDIIYLGDVEELDSITTENGCLRIGAAVSLERACSRIVGAYPTLSQFFRRFASLPVRNAGTLVGNIANGSPIGDSMPALIVLGASVILRQGDQQREIPLQDLYIDYMKKSLRQGEFVEAVKLPLTNPARVAAYKLSKRFDQDISAVCAAFALHLDSDNRVVDIRIAYGGMAAIPKRATETETRIIGNTWNERTLQQAVQGLSVDFQPLNDMRASSAYRAITAANLLHRFYLQTRQDNPLPDHQVNVFDSAVAIG